MGVDESLARGLTNRLFRDVQVRTERCFSDRRLLQFCLAVKRQRWIREAEMFLQNHRRLVLNGYVTPSKRRPVLAVSFLVGDEAADFQDWTERCLKAKATLFAFDEAPNPNHYLHLLEISAHAVQRLLQRAPVGFIDAAYHEDSVLDELRPLEAWGNLYTALIGLLKLPDEVEFFPVLPSEHGIFLCNAVRGRETGLSVRTFVGNHQLRPAQRQLRDRLTQAFRWSEGVPYFALLSGDQTLRRALAEVLLIHLVLLEPLWWDLARSIVGGDEGTSERVVQQIVSRFESLVGDATDRQEARQRAGQSGRECLLQCYQGVREKRTLRAA